VVPKDAETTAALDAAVRKVDLFLQNVPPGRPSTTFRLYVRDSNGR
jgi:hypothetical protein